MLDCPARMKTFTGPSWAAGDKVGRTAGSGTSGEPEPRSTRASARTTTILRQSMHLLLSTRKLGPTTSRRRKPLYGASSYDLVILRTRDSSASHAPLTQQVAEADRTTLRYSSRGTFSLTETMDLLPLARHARAR